MSVTVRFTDDKLGRKQGSTEVVYDETLARVWIDACMAEAVGSVARSVDQPPADRAIGSPPVRKGRRGRRAASAAGRNT